MILGEDCCNESLVVGNRDAPASHQAIANVNYSVSFHVFINATTAIGLKSISFARSSSGSDEDGGVPSPADLRAYAASGTVSAYNPAASETIFQ